MNCRSVYQNAPAGWSALNKTSRHRHDAPLKIAKSDSSRRVMNGGASHKPIANASVRCRFRFPFYRIESLDNNTSRVNDGEC